MSTVLLLHGLGGSPAVWGPVIERVGDAAQIAAPALTGSGTIAAAAAALEAQLPPGGGAVVVGHSMGGLVATALAERFPDRIARLVLVSATPTRASRISARSPIERMLRVPGLGQMLWAAASTDRLRSGLSTAVAPGTRVPPVLVRALQQTPYRTFVGATQAIDDYLDERPLAMRIANLPHRVTFMYGTEDQRVAPSAFLPLRQIDGLELVALAGVGHTPPLERPSLVADAIREATGHAS